LTNTVSATYGANHYAEKFKLVAKESIALLHHLPKLLIESAIFGSIVVWVARRKL